MELKGQGERKRDSIGEKGYFSKHSSSPPGCGRISGGAEATVCFERAFSILHFAHLMCYTVVAFSLHGSDPILTQPFFSGKPEERKGQDSPTNSVLRFTRWTFKTTCILAYTCKREGK